MHGSTHHHCSWMSRSFSVHTVCVCALFCRVIMCWSLVASNLPVTTHTHTSTHKHTHRPVGCWGAGSASLWASSECQLPAAVCAERTVQRKRNVFPHPSACSSLPLHRWGLLLHSNTTLNITVTHSLTHTHTRCMEVVGAVTTVYAGRMHDPRVSVATLLCVWCQNKS